MKMLQLVFWLIVKLILVGTLFCSPIEAEVVSTTAAESQEVSLVPLKGTFSQIKNIKPLKRPFKSRGSFVYLPNKGLLWHTQKPVESLKLFANEGVYQLDAQGVLQKEAQLDNDFFLALFAGDEHKLAKFFKANALNDESNVQEKCLALTPVGDTMRSLFKQINLCTKEVNVSPTSLTVITMPSKIVLIEARGNHTEIKLQLSSEKVSLQELAYFD